MRNAASGSRRSPRRGVSLLAVLIGIVGVALLAIWGIPAYFAREGVTLDNVSVLLARDLRSAQNRATLLGSSARFVFDRDGWRAFDAAGAPLIGGGEEHAIERRFSSDGVFDGVVIEGLAAGAEVALEITPRGSLAQGGEIELRFLEQRRTIQILRGSGQVVVVGHDEPLVAVLR